MTLLHLPEAQHRFHLHTSILALLALSLLTGIAYADGAEPSPTVDYTPEQVVRIVIDSLQSNDQSDDAGIATVFRFASPGNRANTGPLSRFTQMIKRGFPDMLNHAGSRYDDMEIEGDTAVQAVWLMTSSGAETGYAFQLGLQKFGEYEGMWMTEAVMPLGKSEQSGTRI